MIIALKQSLYSILKKESSLIEKIAKKRQAHKNEYILEVGNKSFVCYYLKQGICRSFIITKESEITTQISFENDIIFPINAYHDKAKSKEYIQAMTNLDYLEINLDEFERLKINNPQLCYIEKLILQISNYQHRNRAISLQTKTAQERYIEILENEPRLIKYCYLTHIASYLGIQLGSLSRIRNVVKNSSRR